MQDIRGIPVSGANQAALEHSEAALLSYQTFVGDPIATIERALVDAPDFILGHLMRAGILMTAGERRTVGEARKSLAAAEALIDRANDREKGLARAIRQLVDGTWRDACTTFDAVLAEYPHDVFALQTAHLFDFYQGDALNLRNRVSRVLPQWDKSVPNYSYLLGMQAFGFEECNQYQQAEAAGRRALELERRDAWAVHAVTHVMEMTGRIDEGIAWLEDRRTDWAPDNGFAFHNFWHLALYRLDSADHAGALALYDTNVYPDAVDGYLVMVDAASLLWRLYLDNVALGDRAIELADDWERRIDEELGYYAFNDLHAVMAFCLAGRLDRARDLIERLRRVADTLRGANSAMTAEAGLPLAQAMLAFAQGDYAATIEHGLPARDRAHVFGGSHAQRDVVTLTLIEAALRGGRLALARHLIAERTVYKPASAWGWRLSERAGGRSRQHFV